MAQAQGKQTLPAQHQDQQPGIESDMAPRPDFERETRNGRLQGKVAIVTGGDSGIGRAVCVAFAKEGADVVLVYLNEHDDAAETKKQVEEEGVRCLSIAGDVGQEEFCRQVSEECIRELGHVEILVNNASEQHPQESILDITEEQLVTTFRTNVFGYFFMVKAILPQMKEGAAIVNTVSVTAYRGSPQLLDYSATKGAEVAFTRSLSMQLAEKMIRVNAVAPGPIWTPLIPSTFPEEKVKTFGADTPMGRPGQPEEVAPAYVFLASDDASYISGQVVHVNGGEVVNG